jgi:hypothetical protein
MRHFGILLASAALGAALVPGGPGLAFGRGGGGGGGHFGGFGPRSAGRSVAMGHFDRRTSIEVIAIAASIGTIASSSVAACSRTVLRSGAGAAVGAIPMGIMPIPDTTILALIIPV